MPSIPMPQSPTHPAPTPARRPWALPQLTEMQKLSQLTLQTGGGDGVIP